MRKPLGMCLAVVLFATLVQAEDWQSLLHQTAATNNPLARKSAEDRVAALLKELVMKHPADVETEIEGLLRAANDPEPTVQLNAVAILATLAMTRSDGATVLRAAMPTLLHGLVNPNLDIRRASLTAIVNLKPAIPPAAVNPLVDILQDEDPQIIGQAAAGLTLFCASMPSAADALTILLSDRSKSRKLSGLEAMSTGRCVDPSVLAALGRNLEDTDSEIVMTAIKTVGRLGAAGGIFREELQRIVATNADHSIALAASSALQRVR